MRHVKKRSIIKEICLIYIIFFYNSGLDHGTVFSLAYEEDFQEFNQTLELLLEDLGSW